MIENGGVIRRRFNSMTAEEQDRIKTALKQRSYRSNEKDALAWIIFGLVVAVTCAIAAASEANWNDFIYWLQSGKWFHAFFGGENIIVTGFIASVIAIMVILEYWRRIYRQFGYVMLSDAIVRVRGQRVVIVPFDNIVRAEWRNVETRAESLKEVTYEYRQYSVLELHLADGKSFNVYACMDMTPIKDKFITQKENTDGRSRGGTVK